jgi:hypothetical protein
VPQGRYTADSPKASPPLYLAINVYRSKSGWMVSTAIRQAGGRAPRTHRRLNTFWVADGDKSLEDAALLGAKVLAEWAKGTPSP